MPEGGVSEGSTSGEFIRRLEATAPMTHLPVLPADAEAADGRGAHPARDGGGTAAQLTGDHQLHARREKQVDELLQTDPRIFL